MRFLLADDVIDTRVKVIVLREGREEVVYVEPAVLLDDVDAVSNDPLVDYGIVLDDRDPDRIVVWRVIPRSPAFYAGIRAGDVITTFHGQRVARPQELIGLVGRTQAGVVAIEVSRGQRTRSLELDLARSHGRDERHTTLRPNADERRTNRHENGDERREEGRETPNQGVAPQPQPQVAPQPQPQPSQPQPEGRPRLFPRLGK